MSILLIMSFLPAKVEYWFFTRFRTWSKIFVVISVIIRHFPVREIQTSRDLILHLLGSHFV